MIAALRGKIFEKENGKVFLDVNDVIYELNVSVITFSNAKDGVYYITEIIKENEYSEHDPCPFVRTVGAVSHAPSMR